MQLCKRASEKISLALFLAVPLGEASEGGMLRRAFCGCSRREALSLAFCGML